MSESGLGFLPHSVLNNWDRASEVVEGLPSGGTVSSSEATSGVISAEGDNCFVVSCSLFIKSNNSASSFWRS